MGDIQYIGIEKLSILLLSKLFLSLFIYVTFICLKFLGEYITKRNILGVGDIKLLTINTCILQRESYFKSLIISLLVKKKNEICKSNFYGYKT